MKFGSRLVYAFLKHIFNPLILRNAGSRYSPFSVVQHLGRRSRKRFETPVIVVPYGDSFLFALTYGPQVDWYQNVLAAGECGLKRQGQEVHLVAPRPVDKDLAIPAFPAPLRWVLRWRNIQYFFTMKVVSSS